MDMFFNLFKPEYEAVAEYTEEDVKLDNKMKMIEHQLNGLYNDTHNWQEACDILKDIRSRIFELNELDVIRDNNDFIWKIHHYSIKATLFEKHFDYIKLQHMLDNYNMPNDAICDFKAYSSFKNDE